jgi:hypothetical protein
LHLPAALAPWLDPLTRGGLVVLLVPFMLLSRHELRNRMVRLVGFSRLAVTTRALDEAGDRVTRYSLTQSLVNATFGTLVGWGCSSSACRTRCCSDFSAARCASFPTWGCGSAPACRSR